MVKSGKYTVKQPSIFGRIGTGIGKGLAEQLPKEMERGRLAQGLEKFEKEAGNLTPLQQATRLFSIPGITPQMVQVLPELIRQQRLRQSFTNRGNEGEQPTEQTQMMPGQLGAQGNAPSQFPQNQGIVQPTESGQPQIVPQNPLRNEVVPRKSWSPERLEDEVGKILEERPDFTIDQAFKYAQEKEQRYLNEPESVRRQDDYFREQQKLADNTLDNKLKTLLQKQGGEEALYSDITGRFLNNLRRSMYRDLRTNHDESLEDITNRWAQKALKLSEDKKQLETLSQSNIFSKILRGSEFKSKLDTYSKIFAETGNQQEYYHKLISDFDLSPQGASAIAYPLSKGMKEYVNKPLPPPKNPKDILSVPGKSRKYANEIGNHITGNDSILAIAKSLKDKNVFFDERAFFNQLREDMDRLSLTPRQRSEIAEGESGIVPTWGDILIFPIFRKP